MAKGLEKENEEAKKKDKGYDTCNCVWEMYKIIYNDYIDVKDGKNIKISECFNMKRDSKKEGRKYAPITEDQGKKAFDIKEDINLSGDVIFNFSNKFYKSCEYYIENGSIYKEKYKELLEKCKKMNHSFENCAVLLSEGNLQQAKKGIGNDRGDTFIWALDEYYNRKSEMILNHGLGQLGDNLRKFLDYFGNVYKYCEVFYNIKDKDNHLISDLKNFGQVALNSVENVEKYIDLALEFWKERAKYMKNKYKENREKYINEKKLKYENLDEIFTLDEKETVEQYITKVEKQLGKNCKEYENSAVYKEKIIYESTENIKTNCENLKELEAVGNQLVNNIVKDVENQKNMTKDNKIKIIKNGVEQLKTRDLIFKDNIVDIEEIYNTNLQSNTYVNYYKNEILNAMRRAIHKEILNEISKQAEDKDIVTVANTAINKIYNKCKQIIENTETPSSTPTES